MTYLLRFKTLHFIIFSYIVCDLCFFKSYFQKYHGFRGHYISKKTTKHERVKGNHDS